MRNRVFVIDSKNKPLAPCLYNRAYRLLRDKKATVANIAPFTIKLNREVELDEQPTFRIKVDPGSTETGIALVGEFKTSNTVVWAANLEHRGNKIKSDMESRASIRRGRRSRLRYRKPRFDNRRRPDGWLPPSLMHRVLNADSWCSKLLKLVSGIQEIDIESVRFDMQKMRNPEISGIEYQQGKLMGYEVREYLLEKYNRTCVYCGIKDVPMEVEHVVPKSKGGTNSVNNLVLSCGPCNQKKSNKSIEIFLKSKPTLLKKIKKGLRTPLKDAAAVNATRNKIVEQLKRFGLRINLSNGAQTKYNRFSQGYTKDHWIDAACVGDNGSNVDITSITPLLIKSMGRGNRRVVNTDKYGFPNSKPQFGKRIHGFSTGDFVKLKATGKYAGEYVGQLASIKYTGTLCIKLKKSMSTVIKGTEKMINKFDNNWKNFELIKHSDGYNYT